MFRQNQLKTLIYILILVSFDLLVLLMSLEVSLFTVINYFGIPISNIDFNGLEKYYWIIAITILMLFFEKIYYVRYDFWSDTKKVLKGLLYSFVAVFVVINFAKVSNEYSRILISLFFLNAAFLIPFTKRLIKRIIFKFNIFKINVKVVSNSSQKEILSKEIKDNWYLGFREDNEQYDLVLISSKNFDIEKLQENIREFSKKTRDIYIIPYLYNIDFSHTEVVDYFNIRLSAIHIENRLLNKRNIFVKYFFEKLLVLCLFPIILCIHIIMSIIIKLDSKGPVIFKQKRLGRDGKLYSLYKYRTMYCKSDDLLDEYLKEHPEEIENYKLYHKYENDPRITRVGEFLRKTSLDEIPQFYNVLRGDMNLIGPRPYMDEEKEKIGKYNREIILNIKPGITGLWQVSGRSELVFEDRIELDKWYIKNWSLWMDFVIFMKTIKVVLLKVGAK